MKVKIQVPTSLKDIPLHKYQKYLKIVDINKEDENSEIFLQQKMLEIFCGLPFDQAINYRMRDIDQATSVILNALNEQPDLVTSFTIGNTKFGFIPSLEDISFGEYIDIDSYMGDWDNMHKLMAVLYRPIVSQIKDKYLIEEYKGDNYHDAMLHTPMNAVISSLVFFYRLEKELLKSLMDYLEKVEKVTSQQLQTLTPDMDGINQSIRLVEATLPNLKKSQD